MNDGMSTLWSTPNHTSPARTSPIREITVVSHLRVPVRIAAGSEALPSGPVLQPGIHYCYRGNEG